MSQFFQQRGSLEVSIGEGQISAFEVAQLKEDDVVVSRRFVGEPCRVTFNGGFICRGQVVIVGHLFGVRVYSLAEGSALSRHPVGGDRVMELLPFSIRLGSIQVSLQEIGKAARGTIISLGKEYSEEQDAELIVAGVAVASGKVVVYGENMALRIVETTCDLDGEHPTLVSGAFQRAGGQLTEIVPFNFKRPDIFTRSTLDRIGEIHRSLSRSLAVADSRLLGMRVQTVDQLTVHEMMERLRRSNRRYLPANTVEWRLGDISFIDPSWPRPPLAMPLVEESGTTHRVADRDRAYIAGQTSGGDSLANKPILIGWSTTGVVGDVFEQEAFRRRILSLVRDAWRTVVEFNLREEAIGTDVEEIIGVHRNELALLIDLALDETPDESVFFLYPALTLYPVLTVLSR